MYLNRIHLDLRCREARRDLSDPYQLHSTLHTEFRSCWQFRSALRTAIFQPRAAFHAKSGFLRVFMMAFWAFHDRVLFWFP